MCKIDVKIGTGGEYNWAQHTTSTDHLRNSQKQSAPPVKKLTSFFAKLSKPVPQGSSQPGPSTSASEPPRLSSNLNSTDHESTSNLIVFEEPRNEELQGFELMEHSHSPIDVDTYENNLMSPSIPHVDKSSPSESMLSQLRRATTRLPESIAFASPSDTLARFSGDPEAEAETYAAEYEDPWEMVDKSLNAVIGYGKTVAEIANLIRRGTLGMDGVCNWLEICLDRLHISPDLLEGKMQRFLDAMALL